ncbi:hypothetical protein ACLMPM_21690 [Yersinia enterocolitica]|uniref:hypothetical protein n=1 Tax=Yersinia enterocolitica TaxID=630 RepID=UPI00398D29A7
MKRMYGGNNLARQTEAKYKEAEFMCTEVRLKAENEKKWKDGIISQWQKLVSEIIAETCPQHSNINKKLVHLRDIRNYKNNLAMLVKEAKNKPTFDRGFSLKVQSLHDIILESIKAIYTSTYNHRNDKLADLYSILFTLEYDLLCPHPILVKDMNGMMDSEVRGLIPMRRGPDPKGPQRRMGISGR